MMTNGTGALIVGAGPTGLTLACELARRGAPFRIVSAADGPSTKVKASELQSRTLEVFEDMGLRERAEELGVRLYGLTMYAEGQRVLHMAYDDLDAPFPYKLVCGQVHTERLLGELLASLGGGVEWGSRVEAVDAYGDGAVATVRGPRGVDQIGADWVIGCDGAHSTVREVTGATLEGKTYPEEWILGDVKIDWDMTPDEQYGFLSGRRNGLTELTCQPLPHNRWQVGGPLPIEPGAPSRNGEQPTLAELQDFFDRNSAVPARLSEPTWLTIYRVHQRRVTRRVHGRLILAGDAAHLSSPVGGVGMNTGIQDAYNLGWKLALVLAGAADPQLIESYNFEREAVVRNLFSVSNRQHLMSSLRHPVAKELRNHLLSVLTNFDSVTDRIYRDQSQTTWGYRGSPIVGEESGAPLPRAGLSDHGSQLAAWTSFARGPRAGDRAPDALEIRDSDGNARRLFEVLAGAEHVLLYFLGCEQPHAETLATASAIARRIREVNIAPLDPHLVVPAERAPAGLDWDGPMIFDPSQALHNRYGARGECLVLIRPDGYIGFRAQPPSLQALLRHLHGIFTAAARQPA
ncbi:MAG: FAD-dependent monooxygenase [Mycobacterium sp.]